MILGITGHRPQKIGGYGENPLRAKVRDAMRQFFVRTKPSLILSGMALGVDQWACELALSLHIPYSAYVPFAGQEELWPRDQRAFYNVLLRNAKETIFVSNPGYSVWKMQKRNERIVDDCSHLLAVFDNSDGGTANCVSYAERVHRDITIIDPRELGVEKRHDF